jgi:hypothetical protein
VTQETEKTAEDLEQLRQRLEEFRRVRTTRGALPEQLWHEAAQAARRHGVNVTAKVLGLAYSGLKTRMQGTHHPKRKAKATPLPTFVELVGPAVGAATGCTLEVEAPQGGKLRLDLKSVATSELAILIRAFMGR